MAVVTVPDTQPSRSPKAFATKLFNSWGIGKSDVDNGLLFLVSAGERRTEIETGYGIEGVLTDAELGNILRTQVSPEFKRGDFDAGVLAGVQTIAARLETQTFSAAATAAAAVTVAADLATAAAMPVGEALAVALAVRAVPAIAGKRTFTVGSSQLFACRFHHMSRVSTPPIFGRSWQDIKNISLRVLCF
ncbi:MAG: TPM domain-containing protein [Cyanobacteria bacterium J06597_16]